MIVDGDEDAEPHLTAEEVQTLLGFVQRFNPVIVGGQAVNIWAELYHGMDEELDGLGELTSKDLDFYHNREAERALANSLDDGLLEIPSGDNHTPNAAVVKGKLGNRDIVVDFLAQIKGVEGKSLLENSITFADAENPEGISVTLMHPLDCVRSRLSNINMLGRRSDHSLRQAVASLLILECYIEDQLSDLENKPAVKRALTALGSLSSLSVTCISARQQNASSAINLGPSRSSRNTVKTNVLMHECASINSKAFWKGWKPSKTLPIGVVNA